MSFVHLHLHSQYSLLDGYVSFERLFKRAQELEMPAVALTDHGNMFGAIEFYQQAAKADIKPIVGCELYLSTTTRDDRQKSASRPYHLLTLAKNMEGYRNLCRLVSRAFFEGFYYKPRVDWELLKLHHEGLICTSSCLRGEIPSLILSGMVDEAKAKTRLYRDTFGEDFYIELMDHGLPEQSKVNQVLIELAQEFSIGMIATNDCHYLHQCDARVHDALICIQSGKNVEDTDRLRFYNDQFYMKSEDEMLQVFSHVPEAVKTTAEVADKIKLEFSFGDYLFPSFKVPEGLTLDDQMEQQAKKGLEDRLKIVFKKLDASGKDYDADQVRKDYTERLEFEIATIRKMGFSGYFLIVSDFIAYAKDQDIPVGPGRGSAAGSLVAFALQITDIDPIPYGLLFERFLNPERISMPDIDIDFCIHGRDQVIRYVADKYGEGSSEICDAKVAQIITFGKMKARAVIRDVGRVLSMPYGDVDRIAKLVPPAINITLKDAFEQEEKFAQLREESKQVDDLLDMAESLEGYVRHASTHAAGVVISDDRPLVDHMPLFRGSEGEVTTQYDMKRVEDMGLIKFDFLGLKTLTVIKRTVDLVNEKYPDRKLDMETLPLGDPKVYELLCKGQTTGIFQLESYGMRDLIKRLKPSAFEDLIALVALYRPGPLGSGMVDDFIKRKHNLIPIEYELNQLEPVLKETYGVILYQEQVMQIAVQLAGYSMADADILRKAMGKKIPEVLLQQKEKFVGGAVANDVPQSKADKIFELIVQFGGYGFNKSHSAAYALISYQTAYLKTHFPLEFMTALLSEDIGNTDKVISYIADCKSMELPVLPPDVNESHRDFMASEAGIRFGMAAIKNIGDGAIESIIEARAEGGPYSDMLDFVQRVDLNRVNRKVVEALIKSGSLDRLVEKRSQVFATIDRLVDTGQAYQQRRDSGQVGLFDQGDDNALPDSFYPDLPEWDEKVLLNFEKESVGFYITSHPLYKYDGVIERLGCVDSESLQQLKEKKTISFAAVVASSKEITTKRGKRMAFANLEDTKGSVEGILFADTYAEYADLLKSDEPLCVLAQVDVGEEGNKLLVQKLTPLMAAEDAFAKEIHFKTGNQQLSTEMLQQVKSLLAQHRGGCATYLHLSLADQRRVTLALPQENWVKPGEDLVSAFSNLVGEEGSVQLVLA